jgi:hypothetical protein
VAAAARARQSNTPGTPPERDELPQQALYLPN